MGYWISVVRDTPFLANRLVIIIGELSVPSPRGAKVDCAHWNAVVDTIDSTQIGQRCTEAVAGDKNICMWMRAEQFSQRDEDIWLQCTVRVCESISYLTIGCRAKRRADQPQRTQVRPPVGEGRLESSSERDDDLIGGCGISNERLALSRFVFYNSDIRELRKLVAHCTAAPVA